MPTSTAAGRDARAPSRIPLDGWKDILWRVKNRVGRDRVALIAAGTAFYLLLAIFPALAALVSLYGLLSDPAEVADHIEFISGILPANAFDIVSDQLGRLAEANSGALSFGFLFGLGAALWSANNGVKAIVQSMNVAYEEEEKRSFLQLTLFTLAVTVGTLLVVTLFIFAVGVVPPLLDAIGAGDTVEAVISIARWPLLLIIAGVVITLIYRYAPSRKRAAWRWLTWGSGLATLGWIVTSLLYSWYLSNLANLNETYGSLGVIVGLMIWLWLSMQILVIGAELDAEMEHQTEKDSTVGPDKPMGERGAVMADTVGQHRKDAD